MDNAAQIRLQMKREIRATKVADRFSFPGPVSANGKDRRKGSRHLFVIKSVLSIKMIEKLRDALYNPGNEPNDRFIMESIKNNMTGMMPITGLNCINLRDTLRTLKKRGITP